MCMGPPFWKLVIQACDINFHMVSSMIVMHAGLMWYTGGADGRTQSIHM